LITIAAITGHRATCQALIAPAPTPSCLPIDDASSPVSTRLICAAPENTSNSSVTATLNGHWRTLYRAAKADPGRRFHALYDKVYRRDVLERAWESVRANRGAAGIDRQTIADVERYGIVRLLDELAADLKDGSYRPLAARRVFIPKPGRPTEQRPLSIAAVRDRVVQAATRIVFEPIFEADFLPCSFGFRPRIRCGGGRRPDQSGQHVPHA
jgi:hypothetical protein